jgi:hypothetical protein
MLSVVTGMLLLSSCIKDTGDYAYTFGNEVVIRHPSYSYSAFLGDTTKIYATRTFSNPKDTLDFDHAWYIDGKLYSNKPVLEFVGKTVGLTGAMYFMTDRKTGITFPSLSGVNITVSSPFQNGWGVLYEKNGKSELAHIRVTNNVFYDYTELYKTQNNGEEMGSAPVKMKDYPVTGGRGMFVIQNGGQGSIELNAYDMKKQLVTKNVFTGGAPENLAPVDMGFFATSDLLVNGDGNVYARFFVNPIAYTTPWMNIPMQAQGGMKISDIWDTWAGSTTFIFMHDKLNNRILKVTLDASNITGGVAAVDTLPKPKTPLPDTHVNLNKLGNWQYIWGGTFNDAGYAANGAILLKNPVGGEIRFQTFSYKSENRVQGWTPLVNIPFTGQSVVTGKSIYTAIKTRDYLFFSGGAANNQLYYFDTRTGAAVTLYAQLSSPITAITQNDASTEVAVGLEDGTVIIYDISNAVIISGVSKELHRLTGLGKVVDVIVKGGQMR